MPDTIDNSVLPVSGVALIAALNQAGYQAWFVGGCVRDCLLGRTPPDWDICTDATPAQTQAIFSHLRVYRTGEQHGTITVVNGSDRYEITTFRRETAYSDHRRPDAVHFVSSLREDLLRRDFTINAMAYHPTLGLADYFDARADLRQRILRCVGNADARFEEDALRILRALRFAGRFSLRIESNTARAIHEKKTRLRAIAAERVWTELKAILLAQDIDAILADYADVFAEIMPEIRPMFAFPQATPHHNADVWTHTLRVVRQVPQNVTLRFAAVLHDSGKPHCFTVDACATAHFHAHAAHSQTLANQILLRLKCDNRTRTRVETLIAMHDTDLPTTRAGVLQLLGRVSHDTLFELVKLRRADVLGQSEFRRAEKLAALAAFDDLLRQVLSDSPCFSLHQLAINGRDLSSIGVPVGREMGQLLQLALEAVMLGEVENEREALLKWVQKTRR